MKCQEDCKDLHSRETKQPLAEPVAQHRRANSPRLADLTELTNMPLLMKVEDNLTRGKSLSLSLMGRIASRKMVVWLFYVIPSEPSAAWFRSLDSYISKFLWKYKPARISWKMLQRAKDKGGLEPPNFQHYFLTNRLQFISGWLKHAH